jgi:hypothetical protein
VIELELENALHAPILPASTGFSNDTSPALAGSTHTTIYNTTYFGSPSELLADTFVGKYSAGGTQNDASAESDFANDVSPADSEVPVPNVAPSLSVPIGFIDGTLVELGALAMQMQSAANAPTGIPFIDDNFAAMSAPSSLIALFWQTTGDVQLLQQSGTTALELVQPATGSTSVSQTIVFPDRASSIDFDLGILNAGTGDQLQVLLNGTVLSTVDLDSQPANSKVSVSLAGTGADTGAVPSGTITFQLVSGGTTQTSISLGNFTITQVPNTAPTLTSENLSLPTISGSISDSANPGVLVSSFLGGITDRDPGALQGIAIVGTDSLLGTLQFTLDAGTTWINVGTVSDSQALLLAPDSFTRIRLVPNGLTSGLPTSGSITDAFTFRAWDQTTGISALSGELYDASTNGGTSAFSAATDQVAITVLDPLFDTTPVSTVTAAAGIGTGNVVLATFTDGQASATASDFTPTVNLGGTLIGTPVVSVQLVSRSTTYSTWEIVGNATYSANGQYSAAVTVSDGDGTSVQTGNTSFNVTNASPSPSLAFAGEYAVATTGNNTLTLASITQNGAQLTLTGSTTTSATIVVNPGQLLAAGAVVGTVQNSTITFSSGVFAGQVWTKLDLPPDFTNQGGGRRAHRSSGSGAHVRQ